MDERHHAYREIASQPEAWQRILEMTTDQLEDAVRRIQEYTPDTIILCGCGCSYWGALSIGELSAGKSSVPIRSVTGSELWLFPERYLAETERPLFVFPSRSGRTSETLMALEAVKERAKILSLTVTASEDTELSRQTDMAIEVPGILERSVCQTRSFTGLYLALLVLLAGLTGDGALEDDISRLPDAGAAFLEQYREQTRSLAEDAGWTQAVLLGSVEMYGLACEGALILLEMAQTPATCYRSLEVRHGPTVMIDPATCIILFAKSGALRAEETLINELGSIGARTLVLAGDDRAFGGADHVVSVQKSSTDACRGLVYSLLPQLVAYYRAVAGGIDPDRPQGLTPWIELDP